MERTHHVLRVHRVDLTPRSKTVLDQSEGDQVKEVSVAPYAGLGELAFAGGVNFKVRDAKKGESESFITSHATSK